MRFDQFLAACGLAPKSITAGKWQRCPTVTKPRKKNGSYKLSDDGQIGWAIDYAVHSEHQVWRAEGETEIKIDRAAIARRAAEERRMAEKATAEAIAHYRASNPLNGSHPYLADKGLAIDGCGGLRVNNNGSLIVPMFIGEKLTSIQSITPDGAKRFWPGAHTGGAWYQIGDNSLFTVIVEGLATGLRVYQAIKNCRVVVAFNAGNLMKVAQTLPKQGLAVVAADNDHETAKKIGINPGLEKAKEVADCIGVGFAYPDCVGTDWDDYAQERREEIMERECLKSRPMSDKDIAAKINAEIAIAIKRHARMMR